MSKGETKDFLEICGMISQYSCCVKIDDGNNHCIVFFSSEIDSIDLAELLGRYLIDLVKERECAI